MMVRLIRTAAQGMGKPWGLIGTAVIFFLVCLPVLYNYVIWQSVNFIIGCIALPILLQTNRGSKASNRYTWVALGFCFIYFLLPVKTCLYVVLALALLGLWEAKYGKTTIMAAITLLMMAPVAQYFADSFSFPLRLQLTKLAGRILNAGGVPSIVSGNMITCNSNDFSVDPACMGLNMILTSLLCTILIIALQEHKERKRLSTCSIVTLLGVATVLNVIANLIRILVLVLFNILPSNPMHEIMGILCLIVYVLLPVMWLVKRLLKRKTVVDTSREVSIAPIRYKKSLNMAVLVLMAIGVMSMRKSTIPSDNRLPVVAGYTASWYDNDITRLQNDNSLVYMKRLRGFYFSEHNPMLCWTGCGYTFKQVDNNVIEGISACTGILERNNERLYTAWWYDNGTTHTSNVDWRLRALRGEHEFCIVNVTAGNMETLRKEVKRLVNDQSLRGWLGRKAN